MSSKQVEGGTTLWYWQAMTPGLKDLRTYDVAKQAILFVKGENGMAG